MKRRYIFSLMGFVFSRAFLLAQAGHLAFVDPLIGSLNGGNITPSAQVPFGFISFGPDTMLADFGKFTNGYNPSGDLIGLSYTHESGTGGDAKYGNFRVTPTWSARLDLYQL